MQTIIHASVVQTTIYTAKTSAATNTANTAMTHTATLGFSQRQTNNNDERPAGTKTNNERSER